MRVAGVRVGDIGKVELEDGKARRRARDRPRVRGPDPSGRHRAAAPEDRPEGHVPRGRSRHTASRCDEGDRIPMANTAPDIDPDEFLSALDTDTRDYLKLLITGAGKGLDGRGDDLREVFERFEPLHRDLARVTTAIAAPAREPEAPGQQLRPARRGARRQGPRADAPGPAGERGLLGVRVRGPERLGVRLEAARRRSTRPRPRSPRSTTLGDQLGPTLEALRPAFRELDDANKAVLPLAEKGTPIVRDEIRPFARDRAARTRATSAPPPAGSPRRVPT